VHRHTRRLLAIARRQSLDDASAADVVQTAWRNYAFLFQSDAARPLQRWVEFFGYHVG